MANSGNTADIVTRILYGAPDGMRFTQDSPVLREVWLGFVGRPRDPMDLLIVPWEDCHALDLADTIHNRLVEFRETASNPEKRVDADIADLPGVVAARLYFDEACALLLPQTKWWEWSNLGAFVALAPEVQRFRVRNWAEALRDAPDIGLTIDLAEVDDADGQTRPSSFVPIEDPDCRIVVLAGLIASGQTQIERFDAIDPDAVAQSWLDLVGLRDRFDRDPTSLIFTISANRVAGTTVADSVPTTKADAAYRLFDLDCSKIGWAVIDSGIDATHEAFRDASLDDTDRNDCRVVQSYNFACFRDIRSRDRLLNPNRRTDLAKSLADPAEGAVGELDVATAEAILAGLAEDIEQKRPTDFAKIERLLRIRRDARPENPHGTHVAGILGGASWSYRGRPHQGMCPDIRLYDFRVLSGTLKETEFAVIGALRLINHINRTNNFIRIHGANLSLALQHDVMNYACGRTPVCVECETLVKNGVVVVAAAGNQGYHEFLTRNGHLPLHIGTSITDPGNAELVITVGSTHRIEPHNYGVSYFSSRGPTGDGRSKPDIVAPGEKICAPVPKQGTARKGGTSMAAPHVSGAAAMLMARFPELIGRPDRIKAILCGTATDLGRERAYQGSGLLDVLRALQSV